MFERLKLKRAKRHDASRVTRLFSSIDSSIQKRDVEGWIGNREVFVLKDRKKIKGAFSFATVGILGLFGFLYIRKLAIENKSRGHGMGSLLIAKIKSLSLKMGATAFFLFSLHKAIRFYEKNRLSGLGRLFWWRKE
ncbi:GNAT family N-acetyltransferase [Candidatus Peregrinibacteria bacterium]|nr:GNAT family N-acetyltransferase [Candidatus Peregrinibacteria bacterium]